jgi:membrane protein implicated in regulation of membrane protease activity
MAVLLEITSLGVIRFILASVPESVGVLLFAIALIVVAVLIRRYFSRGETPNSDEKATKKA